MPTEQQNMFVTTRAQPLFEVPISSEIVNLLTKLARASASKATQTTTLNGGFLYGWNNRVEWKFKFGQATLSQMKLLLALIAETETLDVELTHDDVKLLFRLNNLYRGAVHNSTDLGKIKLTYMG